MSKKANYNISDYIGRKFGNSTVVCESNKNGRMALNNGFLNVIVEKNLKVHLDIL